MLARYSFAVLSFIAVAAAQDSTNTTDNWLISPYVSQGCQTFLTKLNTDTSLKGCLTSVLGATSQFKNVSATFTTAEITTALDSLCSSQACDEAALRTHLTDFGVACAADFENDNIASGLYDMLYTLLPIQRALCVKDEGSGAYCAVQPETVGKNDLRLPAFSPQALFGAELGDLGGASVPFLFVDASAGASVLCSQCFKDVLQVYVTYEDSVQYFVGVNQSPLLQNQGQIWKAFAKTCGDSVAGGIAINAGAAPAVSAAGPARRAPSAALLVLAGAALALFA